MEPFTLTIWIFNSPIIFAILGIIGTVLLVKLAMVVVSGVLRLFS